MILTVLLITTVMVKLDLQNKDVRPPFTYAALIKQVLTVQISFFMIILILMIILNSDDDMLFAIKSKIILRLLFRCAALT